MTDDVRSWLRSSFSTRAAMSLLAAISSRIRTKARMIAMLIWIARSLRRTAESMATPCSVNTEGGFLLPPQLEITVRDFKWITS
jgi:hypothetical protein